MLKKILFIISIVNEILDARKLELVESISIIKLIKLLLMMTLSGCSVLTIFQAKPSGVMEQKSSIKFDDSYSDHLSYWGSQFLKLNKKKTIRLNRKSKDYLKSLYNKIYKNNEFIFKRKLDPQFFLIADDVPYIFSDPSGKFILSSGLILKYLKSEDLLATIMSYEMVKCTNIIYQKKLRAPTGHIDLEKMLEITSINVKDRHEVRKLAFLVLGRSGFDGLLFLRWLQIRNRNTLDFSHYRQSGEDVIQEEFSFKNFLIQQDVSVDRVNSKNSSRGYYHLIDQIKG